MPDDEGTEIPTIQKVSILLIALGQETASEIMKYLSDEETERIAQTISELDVITTE